jgi:hypothetical protein
MPFGPLPQFWSLAFWVDFLPQLQPLLKQLPLSSFHQQLVLHLLARIF